MTQLSQGLKAENTSNLSDPSTNFKSETSVPPSRFSKNKLSESSDKPQIPSDLSVRVSNSFQSKESTREFGLQSISHSFPLEDLNNEENKCGYGSKSNKQTDGLSSANSLFHFTETPSQLVKGNLPLESWTPHFKDKIAEQEAQSLKQNSLSSSNNLVHQNYSLDDHLRFKKHNMTFKGTNDFSQDRGHIADGMKYKYNNNISNVSHLNNDNSDGASQLDDYDMFLKGLNSSYTNVKIAENYSQTKKCNSLNNLFSKRYTPERSPQSGKSNSIFQQYLASAKRPMTNKANTVFEEEWQDLEETHRLNSPHDSSSGPKNKEAWCESTIGDRSLKHHTVINKTGHYQTKSNQNGIPSAHPNQSPDLFYSPKTTIQSLPGEQQNIIIQ